MKVNIRDADAIGSLRPEEVAAYLRASAWILQKSSPTSSLWTRDFEGQQFEVLLPQDQSFRDFALRMGELLQTLAIAEARSQADVYADLLTTYADVIRIRIADPEFDDGTIPLEVHAQVAPKVRDLLLAAACSALQRRAVWHTRKPEQAMKQVRQLRVGQTERGSYVLTVISNVGPALQPRRQGVLFETEPPYERKVTQMLALSLASLAHASQDAALSQDFQRFDESVAHGVSANLCDAVAGLWGEDDRNRTLEFSFSWSPARALDNHFPSHIKFTSGQIPLIREASRLLRDRSPCEEFELEGAVVKLERPEGQRTGRVTVIGSIEGKSHRVLLELTDPHYQTAIVAHQQVQPLRCVGTLVRRGRGFVLEDPRDLMVDLD